MCVYMCDIISTYVCMVKDYSMTYKIQPVSTSSVILIITLLVTSVTNQTIEFDPSLNNTIYIEVYMYIRML